jgi:hypothetical protein
VNEPAYCGTACSSYRKPDQGDDTQESCAGEQEARLAPAWGERRQRLASSLALTFARAPS